jgi:hypothetical protein
VARTCGAGRQPSAPARDSRACCGALACRRKLGFMFSPVGAQEFSPGRLALGGHWPKEVRPGRGERKGAQLPPFEVAARPKEAGKAARLERGILRYKGMWKSRPGKSGRRVPCSTSCRVLLTSRTFSSSAQFSVWPQWSESLNTARLWAATKGKFSATSVPPKAPTQSLMSLRDTPKHENGRYDPRNVPTENKVLSALFQGRGHRGARCALC